MCVLVQTELHVLLQSASPLGRVQLPLWQRAGALMGCRTTQMCHVRLCDQLWDQSRTQWAL